jgi:hypothetical protein
MRRNVIRCETKEALDQRRSNDRSDRDDNYHYETENGELVFEQATPRIAPQRRAVNEGARILRHQVGFSYSHLRPDVDQIVLFWFLFSGHCNLKQLLLCATSVFSVSRWFSAKNL